MIHINIPAIYSIMINVPRRKMQLSMLTVEFGQDKQMIINSPLGEVLKGIKEKGSLAGTATALGISYSHLWNSLRELGRFAESPLFEAKRGGSIGGIAKLTSTGERFLSNSSYLMEVMNNAVHEISVKDTASADLVLTGSQCAGLEVLIHVINQKEPSFKTKVTHVGSTRGLEAVRRGEADLAGIHLLDEDTGYYNNPSRELFGFNREVVVIHGYRRRQGLMVKKGNPKGVQNLKDLLLGDLIFINRNRGSGTRVLLDFQLGSIARQRGIRSEDLVRRIKGYQTEAMSSIEVADAVAHCSADVGLGIEAEAVGHGLDFIPIVEERYDFAVRKDGLDKRGVKIFLEALRSNRFRELLKINTTGLRVTSQTGKLFSNMSEQLE